MTGSTTRYHATAFTWTVTLSLVISSRAGMSIVVTCRLTRTMRSAMAGTNRSPGARTVRIFPNRNTTPRSYSLTTLIDRARYPRTTTATPSAIHHPIETPLGSGKTVDVRSGRWPAGTVSTP